MNEKLILGGVFGIGLTVVGGVFLATSLSQDDISQTDAFAVPGKPAMTVAVAHELFYEVTPALLLVVYEAFGESQEDAIYDTLASVTHGEALEYLYLERVGAMAGGGLAEDEDQTIHEIKLLTTEVTREEATLLIDASWQVIGTVGHSEHMHVRGNTYSADLTIAPIDGAWRISNFDLRDVNRSAAGETFLAEQTN
ncbi:MAG: hypothetical protein HRU31_13310 [Rhodobacteraceae bacterium]|nr:hypothetical protein [Paracoccaceae bacterium]